MSTWSSGPSPRANSPPDAITGVGRKGPVGALADRLRGGKNARGDDRQAHPRCTSSLTRSGGAFSVVVPVDAAGLAGHLRGWQPRDGTAPNWPGANGRPLRGCRSRSRARQVSRRASTIAHGLRSSSCKLRRAAPHIALGSADARLRSGEAGFLECSKPGRVRHRNQRCGSTFCRWLSPAWC